MRRAPEAQLFTALARNDGSATGPLALRSGPDRDRDSPLRTAGQKAFTYAFGVSLRKSVIHDKKGADVTRLTGVTSVTTQIRSSAGLARPMVG